MTAPDSESLDVLGAVRVLYHDARCHRRSRSSSRPSPCHDSVTDEERDQVLCGEDGWVGVEQPADSSDRANACATRHQHTRRDAAARE